MWNVPYQADYSYRDYLNEIIEVGGSEILSWDFYPFRENDVTWTDDWFSDLNDIRSVALEQGVPYWGWLQSYREPGVRLPSESDLRMQAYSMLTAGFTGVMYYRFHAGSHPEALMEPDRVTPSALYAPAAKMNAEIANLGLSLRFLESTDIRFVAGRYLQNGNMVKNSTPQGLENWRYGAGNNTHILNVKAADGIEGTEKNGMIGFFKDDQGHNYFMLTNLYHGAAMSADQAALSFEIQFDRQ